MLGGARPRQMASWAGGGGGGAAALPSWRPAPRGRHQTPCPPSFGGELWSVRGQGRQAGATGAVSAQAAHRSELPVPVWQLRHLVDRCGGGPSAQLAIPREGHNYTYIVHCNVSFQAELLSALCTIDFSPCTIYIPIHGQPEGTYCTFSRIQPWVAAGGSFPPSRSPLVTATPPREGLRRWADGRQRRRFDGRQRDGASTGISGDASTGGSDVEADDGIC